VQTNPTGFPLKTLIGTAPLDLGNKFLCIVEYTVRLFVADEAALALGVVAQCAALAEVVLAPEPQHVCQYPPL
jgi:hypothetical protein